MSELTYSYILGVLTGFGIGVLFASNVLPVNTENPGLIIILLLIIYFSHVVGYLQGKLESKANSLTKKV